ncbi:MAG: tellurite resistance TerB family protein [Betaproteobacteria bacterium]
MNIQSLLNQLLGGGASHGGLPTQHGGQPARGGSDLGKYLVGGAAGGALGLLLGSKRGRSVGGKALKYGSVAAVGALAWKLYQEHQARQQAQQAMPQARPMTGSVPVPGYVPPAQTGFAALPAPQMELHAQAMLKAMIAAAKSDGHLDARERELLQGEMARLNADAESRAWFEAELAKPVEPAEVAAAVTSPEMAAEVYLASLLVVDETTTMERAYLDELARRLRLDPGLKADLEARAAQV